MVCGSAHAHPRSGIRLCREGVASWKADSWSGARKMGRGGGKWDPIYCPESFIRRWRAARTALLDDLDQEDPGAVNGSGETEQGSGHEPVEATAPVRQQGETSDRAGDKCGAARGHPRHRPQQRRVRVLPLELELAPERDHRQWHGDDQDLSAPSSSTSCGTRTSAQLITTNSSIAKVRTSRPQYAITALADACATLEPALADTAAEAGEAIDVALRGQPAPDDAVRLTSSLSGKQAMARSTLDACRKLAQPSMSVCGRPPAFSVVVTQIVTQRCVWSDSLSGATASGMCLPCSVSDRARIGHAGPCIVRHRNTAERQQDDEHNSARQTAISDVEVREVPQVNEVNDGAAADARCSQQPVTQIPDGSCQHQPERCRPADRTQPRRLEDDHHGSRHRHAREQHGRGWREAEGSTGVPSDIDGQDLTGYSDRGLTLPSRGHERLGRLVQADTKQRRPGKHRRAASVHSHQASIASRTGPVRRPGPAPTSADPPLLPSS